jgi:hypothetical protein
MTRERTGGQMCERLDCGWKIVSIESGWHLGGNFAFKEAGDEREFPAGTN